MIYRTEKRFTETKCLKTSRILFLVVSTTLHNRPFFINPSDIRVQYASDKNVIVVGKIEMLEERIAWRNKSYSNYPVIEYDSLPERWFRCII
jgi:hypothetical protein